MLGGVCVRARVEIWLYSFFNLSARWGSVVNAMPRPLGKRPGTRLHRRLGGPQGWSGRVQKILLPPEFEP